MSWSTGLKRISLVWWGFWFIFTAVMAVYFMFDGGGAGSLNIFIATGATVVFHKLTCWVIDGFTRS